MAKVRRIGSVIDDRDFSRMGRTAPPEPTPTDHALWRVAKDSRWAEARVRHVPHGSELRFVVGGQGRDETLMQSVVYPAGDDPALAVMSAGTLQNFVGHGWAAVA